MDSFLTGLDVIFVGIFFVIGNSSLLKCCVSSKSTNSATHKSLLYNTERHMNDFSGIVCLRTFQFNMFRTPIVEQTNTTTK